MTTTTTAAPAARTAPLPRIALARTVIELKQFSRERDSVIFTFAFPVLLLCILGSMFTDELAPGVRFTQYSAASLVAAGVALSSFQSLALSIAVEREEGTLKRLRGTPMPPVGYFLGKIGLVLVTSLAQVAVLLAVATAFFELSLPSTPELWLRFAWVFTLGTTAGTVLGIAYSSVPRSAKSASAVVTPVVLALQFVSGVFFVYTEQAAWMQDVGAVFPLKWLAQGMRSVFLPDSFAAQEAAGSWQLGTTALVLAGYAVLGLLLCLRTFRWQRRDAR